jgi:hypothetical protein
MKYLKRFNEELKPQTYRRAAHKLDKMGHTGRAKELKDWSYKIEDDVNITKWKNNLEEYSKFGTYKLNIKTEKGDISGDFFLDIIFDGDSFVDSLYDNEETSNKSGGIWFFVGIIPTTEELLKECKDKFPDNDMGNGFFWGLSVGLDYEIEDDKVNFKKFEIHNYDKHISGDISLGDRGTANRFRNILKKMFTDPSFNYPSGRNDVEYVYQAFEQVILSEAGFSSDYGFKLEDVAEFINTISINTLYK